MGNLSRRGWVFWVVIAVLVLFISIRLVLPWVIQWYGESTLDGIENFSGEIGAIDLNFFKGGYSIRDLYIRQRAGTVEIPFIHIERIDFSVNWGDLFSGALVGSIIMTEPAINIVLGVTDEATQAPRRGRPFTQILGELFPFRIDLFRIERGRVWFKDMRQEPQYELFMTHIDANVYNLTNSTEVSERLFAQLEMTGTAMRSGRYSMTMNFNPLSTFPLFDLNARLQDLNVVELNGLSRAYASLAFEKGTFDLLTELRSSDNRISGYVRPIFNDLSINSGEEQGLLQEFWEGIAGAAIEAWEDQEHDILTTNIPLDITIEQTDVDFMATVGDALRDAFIRAFIPSFE